MKTAAQYDGLTRQPIPRKTTSGTRIFNHRKKIAVIGAGISGLGVAWLLSRDHDLVLFEAEKRLGGHSRTIDVKVAGREVAVDTGFIVFNRVNYPYLCQLFEHLAVPVQTSDMSFAVSMDDGAVEYGCRNIKAAFAQPVNASKPGFWRMFRDIAVFNRTALKDSEANPNMTLGEYLHHRRFGFWFRHYYLLPMSGAIWSTPRSEMLKFPAQFLVRFFANHGLLSFTKQHRWWTIQGGSRNYVERMTADITGEVRAGQPVEAVTRGPEDIQVKSIGQASESFDSVIFACHADTALRLLKDAGREEARILGNIPFQRNRIVLHTDDRLMPRHQACWSSWVYLAKSRATEQTASVTYWMNSLQGIPQDIPLFATLNPPMPVDEDLILDEHEFEHPQYDLSTLASQSALPTIQGRANTWYCGAWTGNGFHEDGFASAVKIARFHGIAPPWE